MGISKLMIGHDIIRIRVGRGAYLALLIEMAFSHETTLLDEMEHIIQEGVRTLTTEYHRHSTFPLDRQKAKRRRKSELFTSSVVGDGLKMP